MNTETQLMKEIFEKEIQKLQSKIEDLKNDIKKYSDCVIMFENQIKENLKSISNLKYDIDRINKGLLVF